MPSADFAGHFLGGNMKGTKTTKTTTQECTMLKGGE
jgi:hypothetical protein